VCKSNIHKQLLSYILPHKRSMPAAVRLFWFFMLFLIIVV